MTTLGVLTTVLFACAATPESEQTSTSNSLVPNCACRADTDNVCNYPAAQRDACGIAACSSNDQWVHGWELHRQACAPPVCACHAETDNVCNYSAAERQGCGIANPCASNDDWVRGWQLHQNACTSSPPPATTTVDALEYFRNTHSGSLTAGNGDKIGFYEVPGQNRFYYVKFGRSRSFERYGFDGTNVWLERDTTWPPGDGRGNDAYDALPFGSLTWAKRQAFDGQKFSYNTEIVGFNTQSSRGQTCRYVWEHPFHYPAPAEKEVQLVAGKDWGGDIGKADSLGLRYNGGKEIHWYAKGFGFVSWEWRGEPTPGLATIVWNHTSSTRYTPDEVCGADLGPVPQ